VQYHGGKSRTCKRIGAILDTLTPPEATLWEPFCGGCWITTSVSHRPLVASDMNKYVVALWEAVRDGWTPPTDVSEEMYHAVRASPDTDPALHAFVGIGCSFGGKWWGGYARPNPKNPNYARYQSNSAVRKRPGLQGVAFRVGAYAEVCTPAAGDVVYCDPPYWGGKSHGYKGRADRDAFVTWCEDLTRNRGATVLVSEMEGAFATPWEVVDTFDVQRGSKNADNKRTTEKEALYRVR